MNLTDGQVRSSRENSSSFLVAAQLGEHAVVFQRRCIADFRFAFGDVAQQAAHDFAAGCFGQRGSEAQIVWHGERADLFADVLFQFLAQFFARLRVLDADERRDGNTVRRMLLGPNYVDDESSGVGGSLALA